MTGHAGHANDRQTCAPCKHKAHLHENLQLALNGIPSAVGKPLGAITPLQQERLTPASRGQMPAQHIHLARIHQRRQTAYFCERTLQRLGIFIDRLLLNRLHTPTVPGPFHEAPTDTPFISHRQ